MWAFNNSKAMNNVPSYKRYEADIYIMQVDMYLYNTKITGPLLNETSLSMFHVFTILIKCIELMQEELAFFHN